MEGGSDETNRDESGAAGAENTRKKKTFVLILIEKDGTRQLPMKIDLLDAAKINVIAEERKPGGPFLQWAVADIIHAFRGKAVRVVITGIKQNILQAVLELEGKNPIPLRPSDAIILALILGSSIFSTEEILITANETSHKLKETKEERSARKIRETEEEQKNEQLRKEIKVLEQQIDRAIEKHNFAKVSKLHSIAQKKRGKLPETFIPVDPNILALMVYHEQKRLDDIEL